MHSHAAEATNPTRLRHHAVILMHYFSYCYVPVKAQRNVLVQHFHLLRNKITSRCGTSTTTISDVSNIIDYPLPEQRTSNDGAPKQNASELGFPRLCDTIHTNPCQAKGFCQGTYKIGERLKPATG